MPTVKKILEAAKKAFPEVISSLAAGSPSSSSSSLAYSDDKIMHLKQIMDKLTASDFGLRRVHMQQNSAMPRAISTLLFGSPKITYVPLHEDDHFSIGLFLLPKNAKMPLHDHPNMTVFNKLLYGKLRIKSYDWLPNRHSERDALLGVTRAPDRPRLAKKVEDKVITPQMDTQIAFPNTGGNIHSYTALDASALFDVLTPPYNNSDRSCNYYEEVDGEEEEEEEDDYCEDDYDLQEEEDEQKDGPTSWLVPCDVPHDYVCVTAAPDEMPKIFEDPTKL
eukprot:TRINITY_DN1310_c2_g1_i1.p1 TRINITY_DN1310_c2_g1~~TRINITY_DN1310_c2_g1_i1.p1  ORF type:complete len:278 (-),score=85.63 TRINITY_DN1310_c2_g1_i1:160-993(-)